MIYEKNLRQIAYLSKKYGKENLVYDGRFIFNDVDKEKAINIMDLRTQDIYKVYRVTPKQIVKYLGGVGWGIDESLEDIAKIDSLY